MNWFSTISRDERGATGLEYAIAVSLIAVVIIAAVATLGQHVVSLFDRFTAEFRR